MTNNYYAKILDIPMCKIIRGNIFFCGKIYFSLAAIKNKIPKKQETTNWCFQSKCKQKLTELYLVKRTSWYQTSVLCLSLYFLCAPFSRTWLFTPYVSLEKQKGQVSQAACCNLLLHHPLLQTSGPWAQHSVQKPCSPLFGKVFWNLDLLA